MTKFRFENNGWFPIIVEAKTLEEAERIYKQFLKRDYECNVEK